MSTSGLRPGFKTQSWELNPGVQHPWEKSNYLNNHGHSPEPNRKLASGTGVWIYKPGAASCGMGMSHAASKLSSQNSAHPHKE